MISSNNIKNILNTLFTKSKTEHDKDINDLNTNMNKGWISSGTIEDIQGSKTVEAAPVGTVIALMGNSAPDNYLICDGTEYNIEDYSELSNYFLEQFGSINYFGGDGTTTFAVPDLTDGRFLKGSTTAGTTEAAGLPNITGTVVDVLSNYGTGAFSKSSNSYKVNLGSASGATFGDLSFSATNSNSIYGNSSTVTPSNISVLYCIKYRTTYNLDINLYDSTHYSEDEEVIGQWIDGKPLYRKVYTGLSFTTIVDNWYSTSIDVTGYTPIGGWLFAGGTDNFALYCAVRCNPSTNVLQVLTPAVAFGTINTIVLEYTKSTDTAFSVDEDIAWTALDSEVTDVLNAIGE